MADKPLKAFDYWCSFTSLFRGSEAEEFRDGRAREDSLRTNAALFAITYREDVDSLRQIILADALAICESVTVLNQFVFTERQRLKSIIYILNSLCDKYKIDLESSLKPGYSVFERLTRIERGVIENQEIVKECYEKQEKQLQLLIDTANGISNDPQDLTVPKKNAQS